MKPTLTWVEIEQGRVWRSLTDPGWPTDVIDAAFEAEVARVQEHIGRPVLRGPPAGA